MPKNECDKYTQKVLENPDTYVVFYSEWCGYSQKALSLLRQKNLPYKGYQIDKIDGQMETLLENLRQSQDLTDFQPQHRTRPVVFHNRFIGGFQELKDEVNQKN